MVEILKVNYPQVGVCGLSCRLCPSYHSKSKSRCAGCKSAFRMAVGCPFITCALKKKGVEFCWNCKESQSCDKWKHHREFSQQFDTFKCYRKLEDNISFIQENDVVAFEKNQQAREELLEQMLAGFNEGRSKSYYCIAATVLETRELEEALDEARAAACGLGMKEKARILHALLDAVAKRRNRVLKLRKYVGGGTTTTTQEE